MATYRTQLAKQIDPYTDSMMTIDRLITMIFLGNMYNISSYFDLDNAQSQEFLIDVPTDGGMTHHVWFTVHGSLNFNASLYEATTKTPVPSNSVPAHNRNRTSDNTCNLEVTHTPTGSGDGTLIYSNQWGGDSLLGFGGSGGALTEAHQWVLKPGTKYLARVTSGADNNHLGVSANIVEFIPENNRYHTKAYSNRNL